MAFSPILLETIQSFPLQRQLAPSASRKILGFPVQPFKDLMVDPANLYSGDPFTPDRYETLSQ